MREFILNSDNFSDLESFYHEVDKLFTKDLSWKTGHNFDALNDILRGGFGVHEYEESIKIRWKNSLKSSNDLGYEETVAYLSEKFKRCHQSNKAKVQLDIENAKKSKGETLFNSIISIINDHKHIELILE